ncbi:MAG: TetR/AcrR family transcriptional regulator [Thermodesulfobacteriota bacterium]|nr:TetR/AcrR family transcriptional regulator [Thermodesulfobacteriota bacterium]
MKETLLSKSDRTRRLIIEKTAPLFNKKGIAGTSLADITRITGLTKGSIYGNFKNKDELVLAAFQFSVENLNRFLDREVSTIQSPLDKLFAISNAYRKLYHRMISYGGCPILNAATDADDTHPALARLAIQTVKQFQDRLTGLVDQAKAAGEIDPAVDAEIFAETALSLLEGGLMLSKLTGSKRYLMNALADLEARIHRMAVSGR